MIKYNKVVKIETVTSPLGFSVAVEYEDGQRTIFGDSRVISGANKMCTQYANMLKKTPAAVSENLQVIKMKIK